MSITTSSDTHVVVTFRLVRIGLARFISVQIREVPDF